MGTVIIDFEVQWLRKEHAGPEVVNSIPSNRTCMCDLHEKTQDYNSSRVKTFILLFLHWRFVYECYYSRSIYTGGIIKKMANTNIYLTPVEYTDSYWQLIHTVRS